MARTKLLILLLSVTVFLQYACKPKKEIEDPLTTALASSNTAIRKVMQSLESHEIQIRFSKINRNGTAVSFEDYDFQVEKDNYFYPASTVKYPIALLALEKLNATDSLSLDTKFYVEGDSLETSFRKEIIKIFAVSDNQAYNRMFEFLGQNSINTRLAEKGLGTIRIAHRLSTDNADDVTTKPLIIYSNDSTTATLEPSINTSAEALKLNRVEKGIGFYSDGDLIKEPFDFSLKNYYPIDAQHSVLKRTFFPEVYASKEQFDISKKQREFVYDAMHKLPKTQGYDAEEYYDSYVKFFMFGDVKKAIPKHIKIYNKVGYAYGTLTDCAYIVDSKNDVEFLLTATILVNKDGIFNDDVYEYDEIGIPFLAALGKEIHQQLIATK